LFWSKPELSVIALTTIYSFSRNKKSGSSVSGKFQLVKRSVPPSHPLPNQPNLTSPALIKSAALHISIFMAGYRPASSSTANFMVDHP